MDIIKYAIERPIAVVSGVFLVVLCGLLALARIPIQLSPDINHPIINVSTTWPGAAPAEVEREIINKQEEVFAGLKGLTSITSSAEQGRGNISLEFNIGTNMDRALLLVSNRLDRVPSYPEEVNQPVLSTAGSDDSAIAWMIISSAPGNDKPINEYGDFINDVVKSRLERVPGIGSIQVHGGTAREIQIVVDAYTLAGYQITVSDISRALRNANVSLGAGSIDEGKRRYIVRTEGELTNLDLIRDVVVRNDTKEGGITNVTIGDIAGVSFGYKQPEVSIHSLGIRSIALSAYRQTGTNVIETMRGLKKAVADLNRNTIPNANLQLEQVYDETVYINSAINLVQQNIWVGGTLAAIILLLFLRSFRATLIVSIAIPVSLIGAFVAMATMGRSINVISLAGMAFSVGMVVDAAIVIMENIHRLREAGYSVTKATYVGTKKVWGAVFVSALTTVMVFISILIMELEAGQLFRDIAVAISVSVVLSVVVSITVIPALAKKLLDQPQQHDRKTIRLPFIDSFAARLSKNILSFVSFLLDRRWIALLFVMLITLVTSIGAFLALPQQEYLPEGNRNLLFGVVIPPPGYNLETTTNIARDVEAAVRPLWVSETGAKQDPDSPPKIEKFFYVATPNTTFIGAVAADPDRVKELKPHLQKPVFSEPGTFGFIQQPSIFGRGLGGGRKIDLDISGTDLSSVLQVANRAFAKIVPLFPRSEGNEWRPNPGLELGSPEVRLFPDQQRLADNGISAVELAQSIDTFNDGQRVTQSTIDGKLVDITLKGRAPSTHTQDIDSLPVVMPNGNIVAVSELAASKLTAGALKIRHRERLLTITLEIRPNTDIILESAIETVQQKVVDALHQEGLPPGVQMNIAGTADQLTQTQKVMANNMLLSVVVVFLVMAVLFESFIYPLIIMLSVPVAAAGGVMGLAILNAFTDQKLDMLTMLGFIILIGIVVNNAILLVHQTLSHIRKEEMTAKQAILLSTQNRIRPIFMSTLTSIFGMLPLVLFPGAGSELYRGLGSVVVGGLTFSAIITLAIVPATMSLSVAPLETRRAAKQVA